MNNALKIVSISLLIIIIIGLTVGFILIMTNKINFNFFKTELVYNENIKEEFNKINISTDSIDIKLVKSKDDIANVKVYDRKDDYVSVRVEDGTLIIENRNDIKNWLFSFGKKEILISLPEKEYDIVSKSTSGDFVSSINLNNADISATSGDIILQNVNNLKIKLTSGDIETKEVNNMTSISTSGDVEISKINNSINVETTSGDIDIDSISITKNSNIRATSGDITINKSSSNIYYDANVTSGNIKIDDNNRHADYELKINTKSGDIRVNQMFD